MCSVQVNHVFIWYDAQHQQKKKSYDFAQKNGGEREVCLDGQAGANILKQFLNTLYSAHVTDYSTMGMYWEI